MKYINILNFKQPQNLLISILNNIFLLNLFLIILFIIYLIKNYEIKKKIIDKKQDTCNYIVKEEEKEEERIKEKEKEKEEEIKDCCCTINECSSESSTPNLYSPYIKPIQTQLHNNTTKSTTTTTTTTTTTSSSTSFNRDEILNIITIERSEFNNDFGFVSGNNLLFTDFNGPLLIQDKYGNWKRIIPEGIKEVCFDNNFNTSIHPYSFPESVTTIKFGSSFNKTIEKYQLPTTNLTKLYFGDNFTNGGLSISSDVIPSTVIDLGYGHSFTNDLDLNTVPYSVKKLKLGCYIDKQINQIPSNIEILIMGNCFNQKFNTILPNSLNMIFVKSNYKYFEEDKRFYEKKSNQICLV